MRTLSFGRNKAVARLCLISILFILLVFAVSPGYAGEPNSIDTLRQMGKAFATIAEKASPAVVGVKAEKKTTAEYPTMQESPFGSPSEPFDDDFFNYFFRRQFPRQHSPQRKYSQTAQGSGFIISPDGYILTNNHLVGDSDKVTVKLGEESEIEAKVIGTDPGSDVAVIKIERDKLPCLEPADSDALEVGEWVIAIGNPFGLSHTVTAGIVSAKGRSKIGLADYEDFIQTDAAINFGNSGGPLLNLDGKVVGINTAIIGPGGNIGIGLAIPINMAKSIYDQLVASGTVVHGFLGVSIQDLTSELAASFNLKDAKGVLISGVSEDSAASKAGLQPGDIVIELDGQPVEKANVFRNRVGMLKPGTKINIAVLRNGEHKEFTAELGQQPTKGQLAGTQSETLGQLGLAVQNLTDDLTERLGYKGLSGVVVTQVEPGSLAELAGITSGSLIMEVNRKQVKNTKDFAEAVEESAKEGTVLLLVKDERYTRFIVLTLPKK